MMSDLYGPILRLMLKVFTAEKENPAGMKVDFDNLGKEIFQNEEFEDSDAESSKVYTTIDCLRQSRYVKIDNIRGEIFLRLTASGQVTLDEYIRPPEVLMQEGLLPLPCH